MSEDSAASAPWTVDDFITAVRREFGELFTQDEISTIVEQAENGVDAGCRQLYNCAAAYNIEPAEVDSSLSLCEL